MKTPTDRDGLLSLKLKTQLNLMPFSLLMPTRNLLANTLQSLFTILKVKLLL